MKPPTLFVIGVFVVFLAFTVEDGFSLNLSNRRESSYGTHLSPSLDLTTNSLRRQIREKSLQRFRRQAEDSYEDGEYEYEEGAGEEEHPSNGHEEEQETEQPDTVNEPEPDGDEYYDNYDENTKTSPSPPTEAPVQLEHGESSEKSNTSHEKNEKNEREDGNEELEQQQIYSVESTPETEMTVVDVHSRRKQESHELSEEEKEGEERELEEEEEEERERETEFEKQKQEGLERELPWEREEEVAKEVDSEELKSLEIQETGRDDLERYTNKQEENGDEEARFSSASQEHPEVIDEEEEEEITSIATTTTTTPITVSSVSEEFEVEEGEETDHDDDEEEEVGKTNKVIESTKVPSTSQSFFEEENEIKEEENENVTRPPSYSSSQEQDYIDQDLREGNEIEEQEVDEQVPAFSTTISPPSHANINKMESGSLEEELEQRKSTEELSVVRDPLMTPTKDVLDNNNESEDAQEEEEKEEEEEEKSGERQESEQVDEDRVKLSNEAHAETESPATTSTSQEENQVHVDRNELVESSSQETYISPSSFPPLYTTPLLGTLPPGIDSSENRISEEEEEEEEEEELSHEDSRGKDNEKDSIVSSEGQKQFSSTTTLPPSSGYNTNSLEHEVDEIESDSEETSTYEEPIKETRSKIECYTGYQLSHDGAECLDIDECAKGVCGPNQICTNLLGSFRCECPTGFQIDFRNEKNCRDINECEENNGGCAQDCINTQGEFYCTCSDDFLLDQDGRSCKLKPTTTTTTTTTPTTTTTSTSTTTTTTTTSPIATLGINTLSGQEEIRHNKHGCPTPPIPRGIGIAYLYCSRSPVGIHHRHSQLERRLLQDWAARRNKTQESRNSLRFRHRRNLKRRLRQTNYLPGSMCELRCRPGFELKGQYTLHCNASKGTWAGTTTGYCQASAKSDNQNLDIGNAINSESTPNEIPRLPPNGFKFDRRRPASTLSYQQTLTSSPKPVTATTTTIPLPNPTYRPVKTTTPAFRPIPPYAFVPTRANYSWPKPPVYHTFQTTIRPSYHYSPISQAMNTITTPTTTYRNSFIQLTYRYKTPWIKCPDDIKIDLPPNQNLAYVIIPQPLTNADWFRQVSSIPTWAKGLESEVGPGKQRITFRARTSAPTNNTAECSLTLEVRDTEPPRVRECPESFTTRLNPGQNAKAVAWTEPHFSDNVRIASLKKSHEPGTIMPVGEHLINYDAKDPSDNTARCSFTVTLLSAISSTSVYRKPLNTEDFSTVSSTSPKPADIHATMRNVVCYVGKKGRRIIFQSRVVPRGCSEMTVDVVGDSTQDRSVDTLNTVTQNSAENSATSQISSVSFSTHENPQTASAFSQSVSNGRNNNRLVHSTSSVSNSAHGTTSRASSYAIAISSSSRNFDLPFLPQDKQGAYEEDFIVPTNIPSIPSAPKTRSGSHLEGRGNSRDRQGFSTRKNPYHHHYGQQNQHHINSEPIVEHVYKRPNYIQTPQQEIEIPDITPTIENFAENTNNDHRSSNSNRRPDRTDEPEPRKFFRHFDSWDRERKRD